MPRGPGIRFRPPESDSRQKCKGLSLGTGVADRGPLVPSQKLMSRHAAQDRLLSNAFGHRTPSGGVLWKLGSGPQRGVFPTQVVWIPEPQPHPGPDPRDPKRLQRVVCRKD